MTTKNNIIKLVIEEPSQYFCYLDEKSFYTWLESISAVKKAAGVAPSAIEISIKTPLDNDDLYDLIGLMHRYNIDKKCLRELTTSDNEKWFKNPDKYWYNSIFTD